MSFVKSKPHNPTKNHNNWLRSLRELADSCILMTYVLPSYWLRALRALADCHIVKAVPRFGTSMLFGSGSKSASNKHSGVQMCLNTNNVRTGPHILGYMAILQYLAHRAHP